MHSIFRIIDVHNIEENLWQVNLKLTNDNDEELIQLANCLRKEQLGFIQYQRNHFQQALAFYTERLNIEESNRSCNLHDLPITYNNIASIHLNRGKYNQTLKYIRKLLQLVRDLFLRFIRIYFFILTILLQPTII